jgi:glycosyltransferase involved in cell wall biosynthesis
MNVGIVVDKNYPIDREIRTRKIAKSLDKNDDEVYILCRNTDADPAKDEISSTDDAPRGELRYATVLRFSWFDALPFFSFVKAPVPFNPFWTLWLMLIIWREDLDAIVGVNIRAGPNAVIASKLLHRPVIIDIRENHAELAKRLPKDSIVDLVTHHPWTIYTIEAFIYRFSDGIWVVAAERRTVMPDWVKKKNHVSVVSNTPYLTELEEFRATESNQTFDWPGFTLVYIGVLNDFRGLELILQAMVDPATDEDLTFAIAGEGPHQETLVRTAHELGIENRVFFEGWIDPEEAPNFLTAGELGVIPHEVNAFTNTTIPNKLFDMMSAGLPVLATEMRPVEAIISETECGEVVNPDNTQGVAQTIARLRSSDQLDQMARNARGAIKHQYNWENEAETIFVSLQRVTQEPKDGKY